MSRRRTFIEYIESFWGRVDTTGDCWLWTGEVNNMGYGVFMIWEGNQREKLLAHRFSALMAGLPVHSPKDVILHKCDTPRCVRADHFQVGTQADNIRDALGKNRMNLAGLTAPVNQMCRGCGDDFSGKPNCRYCDPCRERRMLSA